MTARERAREVVIQVYKPGNYKTVYITCADAASDVWEEEYKRLLAKARTGSFIELEHMAKEVLGD